MPKKLSAAIISGILLAVGLASAAGAETVLEKVARTGVLTVGARTDLIPYSYIDGQSELVGYSVDIANLVRVEVEKFLGKEVVLDIVEVNDFSDRLAQIRNDQIDFTCDVVFTWERDQVADFSLSYSISGVRLLTQATSELNDSSSLAGKKVGVVPSPLVQAAMKLTYPDATPIELESYEAGLDALEQGEVDALASDSVILAGYTQPRGADNYKLFPAEPLVRYGVACMVPQQNSAFLNLVDYSIARFMDRYVIDEPAAVATINRWFGPDGVVPLGTERLDILRDFFRFQLLTRAQVPPEGIDFSTLGQ